MELITNAKKVRRIIDEYQLDAFLDVSKVPLELRSYHRGEIIQTPEGNNTTLYLIIRGNVFIYATNDAGLTTPMCVLSDGNLMGDLEYCGYQTPVYAEAETDVLCIAMNFEKARSYLNNDVRFLRLLVDSISEKFAGIPAIHSPHASVEDRILKYMQEADDHCLIGVKKATFLLHTSTRTIQRALHNLCEAGKIERVKKGHYRLVADHADLT